MPVDIEGWIEFSPYGNKDERKDNHSWMTWMNISSVVNINDEVNWALLGNPRDFNNKESKFIPIAKNRGFPDNPGRNLKNDIDWIFEHEKNYRKGELFGFTHFYFSEIENIDWQEAYQISIKQSDWGKLFDLTRKFINLKRIGSEQIRFTVWYNW